MVALLELLARGLLSEEQLAEILEAIRWSILERSDGQSSP